MESIFTAKNDEGIVANLQQCKGYELRFMIRHLKQNIKGKNIRSIEKKDAKIPAITTSLFCNVTPRVIEYYDTKDFIVEPVNNRQLNNIL